MKNTKELKNYLEIIDEYFKSDYDGYIIYPRKMILKRKAIKAPAYSTLNDLYKTGYNTNKAAIVKKLNETLWNAVNETGAGYIYYRSVSGNRFKISVQYIWSIPALDSEYLVDIHENFINIYEIEAA